MKNRPKVRLKKDRQAAREAVAKCTNGEDESDDGLLERRNTLDSNATREALPGEPRTAKQARRVPSEASSVTSLGHAGGAAHD